MTLSKLIDYAWWVALVTIPLAVLGDCAHRHVAWLLLALIGGLCFFVVSLAGVIFYIREENKEEGDDDES